MGLGAHLAAIEDHMNIDGLIPHPLDEEQEIGGVVVNPHTAYGKEMRRWEQHRTEWVRRGTNPGNPYEFRPYPRMLYKAQQNPNWQRGWMMETPHPYAYARPEEYERAIRAKETFDRSCQCVVPDESAERVRCGQGWA